MKPKVGQAVSPVVGPKGGNVLHRQDLLSLPPWYRAGVSTVPPTFRSARTTDPMPLQDGRLIIHRALLRMVDNQNIQRAFSRFQPQPELLLHRRHDRRAGGR